MYSIANDHHILSCARGEVRLAGVCWAYHAGRLTTCCMYHILKDHSGQHDVLREATSPEDEFFRHP